MRKLLLGTTLLLLAVCLSLHGVQASQIGVPVPKPTAAGQSITSTPTAPFTWTPVTLPYGLNGTGQMAVGGTVDATTRLSVKPQGVSEKGVVITIPSGGVVDGLEVNNSVGTSIFSVGRFGASFSQGTYFNGQVEATSMIADNSLQIQNGLQMGINYLSESSTILIATNAQSMNMCDATAASLVFTFTTDASSPGAEGGVFTFKKTDVSTHTVTIMAPTGKTIDGASSYVMSSPRACVTMVYSDVNSTFYITSKM